MSTSHSLSEFGSHTERNMLIPPDAVLPFLPTSSTSFSHDPPSTTQAAMGRSREEFPGMATLGVYAAPIKGDGNCLFSAMSDQTYGNPAHHAAIRSRVVEYMRTNSEHYKSFLAVNPGGGTRRNPKRKNVASTPLNNEAPTQEEIDRAFENEMLQMSKSGTYGGNSEVNAFTRAYKINVLIFEGDYTYLISATGGAPNDYRTIYIAHHTWEHYSSVRNINGPHTGLPYVEFKERAPEQDEATRAKLASAGVIQPWQMELVEKSLTFIADKSTIKRALEQTHGNITDAVSKLMESVESGSPSSAQESSSIERDPDSEDEDNYRPTKRRYQRLINRAAHDVAKARRQIAMADRLAANNGSDESLNSTAVQVADSIASSSPAPTPSEVDSKIDDDWTLSQTEDDAKTNGTAPKEIRRLKINPPKVHPPKVVKSHRRRLINGRERKNKLQQQAQIAAHKERSRIEAAAKSTSTTVKDEAATGAPTVELPLRNVIYA